MRCVRILQAQGVRLHFVNFTSYFFHVFVSTAPLVSFTEVPLKWASHALSPLRSVLRYAPKRAPGIQMRTSLPLDQRPSRTGTRSQPPGSCMAGPWSGLVFGPACPTHPPAYACAQPQGEGVPSVPLGGLVRTIDSARDLFPFALCLLNF